MTADELIELFALKPLPREGGYFSETYRSAEVISQQGLPHHTSDKSALTSIYYLLTPETFGAFHRLKSDEIYHFYMGDPVELVTIGSAGQLEKVRLGSNILESERLQHVVPARTWQATALVSGGSFALMGCTVAPGYDADDYEHGDWEALLRLYPAHHQMIMRLTRFEPGLR